MTCIGKKDDIELSSALWHECAGPLVCIPCPDQKVFYFPQGHMEQVETYANQDGRMDLPIYNVPSKILCRVVNVQLKIKAQTDEVYAQVTLIPDAMKQGSSSSSTKDKDKAATSFRTRTKARSFRKILTSSDTTTHSGCSIHKRHALEFLPTLDMSKERPAQDLIVKDLHGFSWQFRHTFRGHPKRHLITSGWSTFVSTKKLQVGDAFIFLRGRNKEFRVGIRRSMKRQITESPSLISGHTMQHGILANAFHALSSGTLFTVYYQPWTSPSDFIIPFNQYMKSAEHVYSIGMTFGMKFEDEEYAEKRYMGSIVGLEDIDPIRWPGSGWRCLKVQWNDLPDNVVLPERVSPWSIELTGKTEKTEFNLIPTNKRKCELDNPFMPDSSCLARYGDLMQRELLSCEHPERSSKVKKISSSNPDWAHPEITHSPFSQCLVRHTLSFPSNGAFGKVEEVNRNISKVNSSNSVSPLPNQSGTVRIFGVEFVNSQAEPPSPQVADCSDNSSPCLVPPLMAQSSFSKLKDNISEPCNSSSSILSNKQCRKCCYTSSNCSSSKSRIKVFKYGATLGRSVDLLRFDGYDKLIVKFDQMFDFQGRLTDGSSRWQVTYTDRDGHMMPIEDNLPWKEFKSEVQRMFIYPMDKIEELNLNTWNPMFPG